MGAMLGEDVVQWEMQESSLREEKILVSVRLRPLSEKETAKNDASDWECINNTTIIHKNGLPERSTLPSSYCFDRVFGSDSSTKEVYKEGAKKIALSVLDGINSSVFAYGQTSSGKTYTMTGITEYTMADIYDHIEKHTNREFVLKFSAMEIYNEAVRDLISSDTTPLRLLDDPERGTVVEKLTEETLRDQNHLMGLLSICEAQRKLGETALNETSSRSHQILRMTVESSAPEFSSSDNSSALSATVNFVDLAGSERASQILSAGARLKEGCHINRSLLTLGTVIRKLSKGRHGHVPFRDSKLTRILQNSLGGNSRTAIICTMNPSHSQVEQSRNTLLFASCAKEVATKAQVNVIMSDKILVKHLQRELARMESELKSYSSASASGDFNALLKERELQIEKLNKEVQELTQQRDPVQSQTEDLLSVEVGSHQHSEYQHTEYSVSRPLSTDGFSCIDGYPRATNMSQCSDKHSGLDENEDCLLFHEYPDDDFTYNGSSPRLSLNSSKLFHHVTDADSEDHCKDVVCIEMDEPRASKTIKSNAPATGPEVKEDKSAPMVAADEDSTQPHIDDDENLDRGDLTYEALRQKVQNLEKTINRLVSYCPAESSNRSLRFARSRSCKAILANCPSAPYSQIAEQDDRPPANRSIKLDADIQNLLKNSQNSDRISDASSWAPLHHPEPSVQTANKDRMWEGIKPSNEGALSSVHNIVPCKNEVDTPMLEIKFPCDLEKGHDVQEKQGVEETPSSWPAEFERQRREIIELWDAFDLPLVHRTCFFLLFNGDPSDSVYMEVELRRLSFLKDALYGGTKTSKDSQSLTLASSARALRRERDELGKQVAKKFSTEEREVIYNAWGIGLRTKQRRQQLAYRLWTDTEDLEHARASASIVAKLVGFVTPGNTPKELFGLSFSPQPLNQKVKRWKPGMPGLR